MCYYFDDIIKLEGFDLDNILKDKKSHKNILISDILYKTLIEIKPFCIKFDQTDGLIRTYDGIKSFLNKDENHYCYKIFLEKCSYQLGKNNPKFLL